MKEAGTTKVGFVQPPIHLLGNKNYLQNLFAALRSLPENQVTPVIFVGKRQADFSAEFPGVEIVRTSILDRNSPAWFFGRVIAKSTSRNILLQRLFRRHGVSALSHFFPLDTRSAVKTIGWIPDFQHVHLPDLFSQADHIDRDREFRKLCQLCDKVIVSSECARADLRSFSPAHAHKAELLRFVATPVPIANIVGLAELKRLYSFDEPYFLLPNQFWAHKNHRIVLTALQNLRRRNKPILVLATGSLKDHRNPEFFPALMKYAAECDVLDSFRVLGQIPFVHLASLMHHAIALINPSRFEGWSTSVEEAKSMGKQIVLSDIDVHREQAPERAFFFPPDNSGALEEALLAALNAFDAQEDQAMQNAAKARFPERLRQFGETYTQIVLK